MSDSYAEWSEVKARGRAADGRADDEQAAAKRQPVSAGKHTCAGTS
jgi:hypothetical protein